MSNDHRLGLQDGNLFRSLTNHDQPSIPEAATGELLPQTAADFVAEQAVTVEVSAPLPVLILGPEYRVE
jgi:hypothetical protein